MRNLRAYCLKIYRETLDEDVYGIRAAHAACPYWLPVEIWDEIGLVVIEDDALHFLNSSLDELRECYRRVCELEYEGDAYMFMFPNSVEEIIGHPVVGLFHAHMRKVLDERLFYEWFRSHLAQMAVNLRREDLIEEHAASLWLIRTLVRG